MFDIFQIFFCIYILKKLTNMQFVEEKESNAMVTPLRKAASYEQRKTNLEKLRSTNEGTLVTVT